MDPILYRAAMEGNVNILLQNKHKFEVQVTPNNNTVLHIAAQFGKIGCVNEILINCSLLCEVNSRGDTPLHIAAKGEHTEIVGALIERARALNEDLENGFGGRTAKEMLRMANEDGNTALHVAARNGTVGIVKMLIEEDPDFSHPPNKAEETPLFLAVERRHEECVSEILKTCTSPSPKGPEGRTALHAAVIFDSKGSFQKLLKWKEGLAKESDSHGWTALHYAARNGRKQMVRELLDFDKSLAYHTAIEDDGNTPLHITASAGHTNVMKNIMSQCPDCCEMVNCKGQNILHVAVEQQRDDTIKFILNSPFVDILLNHKDNDGNAPLHLLAAAKYYMPQLIHHPRVDQFAFNKESMTPKDLLGHVFYRSTRISAYQLLFRDFIKFGVNGMRNLISKEKDYIEKRNRYRSEWHNKGLEEARRTYNTNLIVAALIATVTFAAGFTLPGGFDGNDGPNHGMAILTRKASFKAFVIADTIAVTYVLQLCCVCLLCDG